MAKTEAQDETKSNADSSGQRQEMAAIDVGTAQGLNEAANTEILSSGSNPNGLDALGSSAFAQPHLSPNVGIQLSQQASTQATIPSTTLISIQTLGTASDPARPQPTSEPIATTDLAATAVGSMWGPLSARTTDAASGVTSAAQSSTPEGLGTDRPLTTPSGKPLWPSNSAWLGSAVVSLSDSEQASASSAPALWSETRLNNQFTVITGSASALSEDSLTEFALQQGLDEKTVKWLFMNDSAQIAQSQAKSALSGSGLHAMGPQWLTAQAPKKDPFALPTRTEIDLDLMPGLQSQWSDWLKWNAKSFHSSLAPGGSVLDLGLSASNLSNPHWTEATEDRAIDASANSASSSPMVTSSGKPAPKASDAGLFKEVVLQKATPMLGQELAEKMSLAIGKRILEAFEKGDWQIKIHLRPAELGHVEVDLRMRGNALDAQLSANQSLTRDLLESGLGKLKDSLTQSGMDVASVRVNDGQSSRSGGDSTPRQPQARFANQGSEDGSPSTENPASALRTSNHDGSLDLMA
jgi:flagellar hook-length control protein FliK